ncbi:MAG: RNA polymerase sigma factor RpoH [Desulfuromonas sp.]|nr:MAG: RNA polymerase sigma factor RpoH [Desulfuromonas sp.]
MGALNLPIASDSFEHYMSQINRFELLGKNEEQELAKQYREENDLAAAHKLICANLRFVVKVANDYRQYGLRIQDLVQEGNIGLMLAVRKFDPSRGIRLITYAVWWIRAYIQNFIIKSWSLVKIGTTQAQKKLFFKLNQTKKVLRNLTGNEDTEAIAAELDVDDDVVEEMTVRMSGRDSSLDVELFEGDDYSLGDSLADDRSSQEELLLEKEEQTLQSRQVRSALEILNEREQEIIRDRILADEPQTLQVLAERFDISRERVRQIEQNALRKLKERLAS